MRYVLVDCFCIFIVPVCNAILGLGGVFVTLLSLPAGENLGSSNPCKSKQRQSRLDTTRYL